MFRKRVKKEFPPGTFIPRPARIAAILQLCFAFTAFIWACGYPFMGELFDTKSQMLLYQNVMGVLPINQKAIQSDGYIKNLERNAERFKNLPEYIKNNILKGYKKLNDKISKSFFEKFKKSVQILILGISPFEQAWIFFAVIISVLILKKREGAAQAAWLLPLIVLLYVSDQWHRPAIPNKEALLFPSEKIIVEEYLQGRLSERISEQQEELKIGWKKYLIDHWAHEMPSEDLSRFELQAEQGEFNFNLERINVVNESNKNSFVIKSSMGLLTLYLIWNVFFAWIVNKYKPKLS